MTTERSPVNPGAGSGALPGAGPGGNQNGNDSEWIDALLRNDATAAPRIADDGFSQRVLGALPAERRRPSHRWIVVLMGVVGFVVGLGVLSGGEELTLLLTGLARTRALSIEHLLLAVIPLGVLYWLALGAAWQET